MATKATHDQLNYIKQLGKQVTGRPAYVPRLMELVDTATWDQRRQLTRAEASAIIDDLKAMIAKQDHASPVSDTNPRPCGYCGESCGYGVLGDGSYQCAAYGSMWSDDDPTGPKFAARLLGVAPETVEKWITRGIYPLPSWPIEETGRRLVRRRELLDWAKATGRL